MNPVIKQHPSLKQRLMGRSALSGLPLLGVSLAALAGVTLAPLPARALPQDGVVVAGAASIAQTGAASLAINQSSMAAVIDWQSFDIGAHETVEVFQPSSMASLLNRVVGGGGASQILGTLQAQGRLTLVNPAGITIGNSARIDVAGLVASTANMSNQDFMLGRGDFSIAGHSNARIVNAGEISIRDGGLAALVAPGVENSGTINARLGRVQLAAGETFTLDMYGDDLIHIGVSDAMLGSIVNSGRISADGGVIEITARSGAAAVNSLINMGGVVEARSVGVENGTVVFYGASDGVVNVTGTVDVSGRNTGETGGVIKVLGEKVALTGQAHLDASGDAGGGVILVGGDYQGQGATPTASRTLVTRDVTITADAITSGDAQKVVVWADGDTRYYGAISAKGGAHSGDGGAVEVSGKQNLGFDGKVDTSAAFGTGGSLLLDPDTITIANGSSAPDNGLFTSDGIILFTDLSATGNPNVTISEAALEALTGSLTLQAQQSITIDDLIDDGGTDNVGDGKLDLRGLSGPVSFQTNGVAGTRALAAGFSMNAGDTILVDQAFQIVASGVGAITLGSINNTASGVGMNLTSGTSIAFNGDSTIFGLIAHATNGITVNANLTIPSSGTILDADNGGDGTGTFTLNAGKTLTIVSSESFIIGGDIDISGLINSTAPLNITNTSGTVQIGNNPGVDMNISDAELGRISAASLSINTLGTLTVDGVSAANTAGLGNLQLTTGAPGNIFFSGAASIFAHTLSAFSMNELTISTNLTANNGFLQLQADTDGNGNGTDTGIFTVTSGNTVKAVNGDVYVTGANLVLDGFLNAGVNIVNIHGTNGTAHVGAGDPATMIVSNTELTKITASEVGIFAAGDLNVGGVTAIATAGKDVHLTAQNNLFFSGAVPSEFSQYLYAAANTGAITLSQNLTAKSFNFNNKLLIDGARTIGTLTGGTFSSGVDGLLLTAHSLSVTASGASSAVAFNGPVGLVHELHELSVTASNIQFDAGAITKGNQIYTGTTFLSGLFDLPAPTVNSASNFTVNGQTFLNGHTNIAATGAVTLGAVNSASSGLRNLSINAITGLTLGRLGETAQTASPLNDLSLNFAGGAIGSVTAPLYVELIGGLSIFATSAHLTGFVEDGLTGADARAAIFFNNVSNSPDPLLVFGGFGPGGGGGGGAPSAPTGSYFFTNFEDGLLGNFSGAGSVQDTQNFDNAVAAFGAKFLRNDAASASSATAAAASILTLTGLPSHTSLTLNFLLAVIDSWDSGNGGFFNGPDILNVTIDDISVFNTNFDNFGNDQAYPVGARLFALSDRGFSTSYNDTAYNITVNPVTHSASTATIRFFTSGGTPTQGFQGGLDESFAIDNVAVFLTAASSPVVFDTPQPPQLPPTPPVVETSPPPPVVETSPPPPVVETPPPPVVETPPLVVDEEIPPVVEEDTSLVDAEQLAVEEAMEDSIDVASQVDALTEEGDGSGEDEPGEEAIDAEILEDSITNNPFIQVIQLEDIGDAADADDAPAMTANCVCN